MVNDWHLIKRVSNKRRLGSVHKVIKKLDNNEIVEGFFKHPTASSIHVSGPLVINEYLSYLLGEKIGLPVAKVELAEVAEVKGVVSIKNMQHDKLYNWNKIKNMDDPFYIIRKKNQLIKMFIFDVWIVNIDRNNRNIILYKDNNEKMYNYYLIDHGLSLLGAFKWKGVSANKPYWDNITKYNNRYLKGLPEFLKNNETRLLNFTKEIQQTSNNSIKKIIERIPSDMISVSEKELLTNFLCIRKDRLTLILKQWLTSYEM